MCLCPVIIPLELPGKRTGPLAPRRNFCRTVPSWRRSYLHLLPREKISDAIRDRTKLAWRNFACSETPPGNYSLVSRAKWRRFCTLSLRNIVVLCVHRYTNQTMLEQILTRSLSFY